MLDRYCIECHGNNTAKAGLNYQALDTEAAFIADDTLLENMHFVLAEGEMPPERAEPQLPPEERNQLTAWLDQTLLELENANPNDPGLVVMPRLNHREYQRVLRDLTGEAIEVDSFLVPDSSAGEGFLNVGQAQTMTVGQFEGFFAAAKKLTEHLAASPESGVVWFDRPAPDLAEPEAMSEQIILLYEEWFDRLALPIYEERFDRVKEGTDMTFGSYLEALWLYKHRVALGRPDATFETVAAEYEVPLFASILQRWWEMLHWEETEVTKIRQLARSSFYVQRVAERWHALPAPASANDLETRRFVRQEMLAIEELRDFLNWDRLRKHEHSRIEFGHPPNSTARAKQKADNGQGFDVFTIDLTRPKDGRFYLIAADAWDGNEEDYLLWEKGIVEFADGSERPWQEVFRGVRDKKGRPVAWGSHPEGDELPSDSIGVQAPMVLELRIPEGMEDARILRLTSRLDPDHHKNASVYSAVDDSLPKWHEHVIRERRILGTGMGTKGMTSPRASDADHAGWMFGQSTNIFFKATSKVDQETKPWLELDALDAQMFFWADDELREMAGGGATLDSDFLYHFAYYYLPLKDYLPFMSEEQLAEFETWKRLVAYSLRSAHGQGDPAVEQQVARRELTDFVTRAWRQQPDEAVIEGLMQFYHTARANGLTMTEGLRQAIVPALVSPQFLYRFIPARGTEIAKLDSRHLAEKLAFLLWGSLPDDRLLSLGRDGRLQQPEVLEQEVARMLADERARGFAEEFAGFWLQFADFTSNANPDPERFEHFTPRVKEAMAEEPILFFQDLFAANRPITETLSADYTYLNEPLAEHYGISGVKGNEMRKVKLEDRRRGGILGMGSFLTKNSAPLRTSPVRRGAWLYETVLGVHLPPPPPNVGMISDDEVNEAGMTAREQLEEHRDNPACFSCHDRIDPLGIALEGFDPVGRWREKMLDGSPVDDQGRFVSTGDVLDGLEGLRAYLQERDEEFLAQFCRKLVGYMLGRSVKVTDKPLLTAMMEALAADEYRPRAAILTILTSPQFQYRRETFGDEPAYQASNH